MSDDGATLALVKIGRTISGKNIYILRKSWPARGINPAKSHDVQCKEVAFETSLGYKAKDGGCDGVELLDDGEDMTCQRCRNEFSKHYLRQNAFPEIRGVPP